MRSGLTADVHFSRSLVHDELARSMPVDHKKILSLKFKVLNFYFLNGSGYLQLKLIIRKTNRNKEDGLKSILLLNLVWPLS